MAKTTRIGTGLYKMTVQGETYTINYNPEVIGAEKWMVFGYERGIEYTVGIFMTKREAVEALSEG